MNSDKFQQLIPYSTIRQKFVDLSNELPQKYVFETFFFFSFGSPSAHKQMDSICLTYLILLFSCLFFFTISVVAAGSSF